MIDLIEKEIRDSVETKIALLEDSSLLNEISEITRQCEKSLRNNGKVIFCGNGGSFADAQHLSAEFTSRFLFDRPALASVALGTNNSGITAMANDYGYQQVFARELEALGKAEDTLIAITTSGNSENILSCVVAAREKNISTFVLTGRTGGKVSRLATCLKVPSEDTARIQEAHILIGHIICGLVENMIFGMAQNKIQV